MFEQLSSFYNSLETREKTTLVVASIATVALLIFILFWANAESYKTIYSSNDSSNVQSASIALETAGIPYKVSDDGYQLQVPVEHVGQARISVAGVSSVPGMSLLENMKLGVSPQQERWIYIQALQGELVKTINSLDEVAASRVHIVEVEPSAFLKRAEQSSASVTVKLHPGQHLSPNQIEGIVSLVAGAVRGLKADQVVLVDDSGNLLNGNAADEGSAIIKSMMDARQQHEARYKKTVMEHLIPILGSSTDVSVAVTVDISTSSTETKKHSFDPNSQVTISETIKESSSKEKTPVGIPGSESQLPEQAAPKDEGTSDEKFQSATNYDYTTVSEVTVAAPGTPQKINTSVVVNSLALQKIVDASAGTLDIDTVKKEVNTAIESAVGFSKERGDSLSVTYMPFVPLSAATDLVVASTDYESYIKYALMLLVILLLYVGVIRPIMNTYTQSVLAEEEPPLSPQDLAKLQEDENSSLALARKLRKMVDNFETVNSEDLSRLVEMHEQPSAEVIRRWLRAS